MVSPTCTFDIRRRRRRTQISGLSRELVSRGRHGHHQLGAAEELPTEFGPDVFENFGHAARGVTTIVADSLTRPRLAGGAAPEPPGPARSDGGLFVDGKWGGVYQVHSPGLPALSFPAMSSIAPSSPRLRPIPVPVFLTAVRDEHAAPRDVSALGMGTLPIAHGVHVEGEPVVACHVRRNAQSSRDGVQLSGTIRKRRADSFSSYSCATSSALPTPGLGPPSRMDYSPATCHGSISGSAWLRSLPPLP